MPIPTSNPLRRRLPARYYTDPAFFRDELERFFCQDWICAGRTNQVLKAGDYFLREVAGRASLLLATGTTRCGVFQTCAGIAATRIALSIKGISPDDPVPLPRMDLRTRRASDGRSPRHEGFRHEDYPLNPVHVDVWDGHIFINLSADPARSPVNWKICRGSSALADAELRTFRSVKYEVKANWKLIVTNYNECLHCPFCTRRSAPSAITFSGENDPPHRGTSAAPWNFRAAPRP